MCLVEIQNLQTACGIVSTTALRFVPYEKMEAEGYGYLKYLFEKGVERRDNSPLQTRFPTNYCI